MKTELIKIAKDLEQGTIDDTEAQDLLLGLLDVSKSVCKICGGEYGKILLSTAGTKYRRCKNCKGILQPVC